MIYPTDSVTHGVLMRYHSDIEMPDEGGIALQPPQITAAEVERELVADEWSVLVTGNGDYVPHTRQGKSRPPVDGPEDNR